jgi:hypothetical protein
VQFGLRRPFDRTSGHDAAPKQACPNEVVTMPDRAPDTADDNAHNAASGVKSAAGPPRLFRPSAAALNWVIAIGLVSLGYGMYLRYLVIEQSNIGLACDAGLKTWLCTSRTIVSALFNNEVFGWVGVGAAVLALIRPSLSVFTIGLSASAFGIVLYNAALCGLAGALLILCFARPAGEPA